MLLTQQLGEAVFLRGAWGGTSRIIKSLNLILLRHLTLINEGSLTRALEAVTKSGILLSCRGHAGTMDTKVKGHDVHSKSASKALTEGRRSKSRNTWPQDILEI